MPNFGEKKQLKGIYPFGENLYQKLPILAILGVVSPHFKSDNSEIWYEVHTWDTLPALNFEKKSLRGICPLGEIFTKNSKLSRFLATYKPLFLYR